MPLLFSLFLLFALSLPLPASAGPAAVVTVLTVDGSVSPASADYFTRGLKRSVENGSRLVVLQLDTPGGLDTAMRDIIKGILSSRVPVATFVFPSGARAASAGTYILYASHIAAMAPGTNLGAATPVQVGLGGPEHEPAAPPERKGSEPAKDRPPASAQPSTMTQKQIHDASAYMRSLAQLRGRNAQWAEQAVREAVSLSADEALKRHVIDHVATDVRDLLKRVHGTRVQVGAVTALMDVANAEIIAIEPDWRTRLLAVIASPSLALVLMMLGFYGLLFEFSNPGYVLPGVVGGICLLLGLFALQMLPYNYAGIGLIVLGLAFLVAEVFLPTSGALAVGGTVAFLIGAVILIDTDTPGYGIPLPLIFMLAGVTAVFVLAVAGMATKARRRPVVSGPQDLLGEVGEVLTDGLDEGWATVRGEIWRVHSAMPLARGQQVRVTRLDGLTLHVEPQPTKL